MGSVKSGCCIYIKFGRKKIKLPVNPEEIEIRYPTDHKTYKVLGKGEIVVPGKPSLKEVSWESFFPSFVEEPYVNSEARPPEYYHKFFTNALGKKQVGRLIITRNGIFDTNIRCVLSSFRTKDKGGEPKDIYYEIEFKEYRDYEPEQISVVTQSEGEVNAEGQEPERPVETPVLRVGALVIANGKYWYDSYGSKPFGTANNLQVTVARIVSGRPAPILIGTYGWIAEDQLQIVG